MSLGEYLHEKAEESRHNETIGYLILLIGAFFLLNGITITVIMRTIQTGFFSYPTTSRPTHTAYWRWHPRSSEQYFSVLV